MRLHHLLRAGRGTITVTSTSTERTLEGIRNLGTYISLFGCMEGVGVHMWFELFAVCMLLKGGERKQ